MQEAQFFAPLKNLGLIILDEEHVETYKQENAPCYHALEVAKWRAKEEGARILLGSATPSLESRARALKGVYGYIQLTNRIHQGALPETEIIDLLNPNSVDKDSVLFSLSLRKAMKEALDKKRTNRSFIKPKRLRSLCELSKMRLCL